MVLWPIRHDDGIHAHRWVTSFSVKKKKTIFHEITRALSGTDKIITTNAAFLDVPGNYARSLVVDVSNFPSRASDNSEFRVTWHDTNNFRARKLDASHVRPRESNDIPYLRINNRRFEGVYRAGGDILALRNELLAFPSQGVPGQAWTTEIIP